jgi:hypothetical protein
MYEDSWYSYVPELHTKRVDASSQASKHHRRESLLKQINVSVRTPIPGTILMSLQDSNQISDPSDPILEIFEESSGLKGPPMATLARRAKSYSDFYEVAMGYLGKELKGGNLTDVVEGLENRKDDVPFQSRYEDFEDDLLDASQDEYQYVISSDLG